MGFVSTLNVITVFGDYLTGQTALVFDGDRRMRIPALRLSRLLDSRPRAAGRLDRKHTLSVLYNLAKEHKKNAQATDRRQLEDVQDAQGGGELSCTHSSP